MNDTLFTEALSLVTTGKELQQIGQQHLTLDPYFIRVSCSK